MQRKLHFILVIISVSLLLVTSIGSSQQECIEPYGGMVINQSGYYKFCPGEYYLVNCTGFYYGSCAHILISAYNVTLDCNYAVLDGSLNKTGTNVMVGITQSHVTIKNCIMYDSSVFNYVTAENNVTIENNTMIHTFTHIAEAIHLGVSSISNSTIDNNTISGAVEGIKSDVPHQNISILRNNITLGVLVDLGNQEVHTSIYLGGPYGGYNKIIGNKLISVTLDALDTNSYNIVADNEFHCPIDKVDCIGLTLANVQHSLIHNNTFRDFNFRCHPEYGCSYYNESIRINSLAINNTIWGNRFVNGSLYVSSGNPNNRFNLSGIGNFWDDPCIANLIDSDIDGYYDSGSGYPYSNESGCKVSPGVYDYHPCVFPSCKPDLESPQINFISPQNGSRSDLARIEIEFLIGEDQKLNLSSIQLGMKNQSGSIWIWRLDPLNCASSIVQGDGELELTGCSLEYSYGLREYPIEARFSFWANLSLGWNSIWAEANDSLGKANRTELWIEYSPPLPAPTPPPTCSNQGGVICYYRCIGKWIPASDTDRCCLGYCLRPSPPKLEITGFGIQPEKALPGERIQITAQACNSGDLWGSWDLELYLDRSLLRSLKLKLAPTSCLPLEFSLEELEIGIHRVCLDDLCGEFEILNPPSCDLSNLSISPERAFTGELISIWAQISNPGDLTAECRLELRMDGDLVNSTQMKLDPGEERSIQFSLILEQPGIYNLSLNGLWGRLEVIEIPSPSPTPTPTPVPTPVIPSPSPTITPSPIPSPTPTPLGFELLLGSIAILLGALIRSRRWRP